MNRIDSPRVSNPEFALQKNRTQPDAKPDPMEPALLPEDTVSINSKPAPKGLWRSYSSNNSSATLSLNGIFYSGHRQESKGEEIEKVETSDGELVSFDRHVESSSKYTYAKGLFSGERGSGWNRSSWGRQYRQL